MAETQVASRRRYFYARRIDSDLVNGRDRCDVKCSPVTISPGAIRGLLQSDDRSEVFSSRIKDPDPTGPGTVDMALDVDFHSVRRAPSWNIHVVKHGAARERSVIANIEYPDVAALGIIDIELLLVG